MRGAEGVVLAFIALGEAVEATALANRPDAFAATGEDFVRIGLVAHVPNQPVTRCIEDVMQSDGEFDDPKATAEMTARFRGSGNNLGAQFGCQPVQIAGMELPYGLRRGRAVKKTCQPVHTYDCNIELTVRQATTQ